MVDNVIKYIYDCLAKKKTALASKQKVLNEQLEGVLVAFVESSHRAFKVEDSSTHLPGHIKDLLRLHASNFVQITKREMCNSMTYGGKTVMTVIRYVFQSSIDDMREEQNMWDSSRESLYYIAG